MIRPGSEILDDRGRIAQLHGAGVQRVGERWFAWGEDKTSGPTFTAVACYSTGDFDEWRFEGNALEAGDGDLAGDRIIERPKVLRRPDGTWIYTGSTRIRDRHTFYVLMTTFDGDEYGSWIRFRKVKP